MKWFVLAFICGGLVLAGGRVLAVDIVGHRGASQDAPENTLASYRLAWQQNADAIEGDYYFTRDHQIVCIHDANTQRTTGKKAKVVDLTLAELRQLDAGSWKDARFKSERIPTLQEVLAIVPKGKRAFLEIKAGPEIVPDMKRQIDQSGLDWSQVVIISFNDKAVATAKELMPNVKAYLLYEFKKKDGKWSSTPEAVLTRVQATKADGLDVGFTRESLEIINEAFAAELRQAKLELHVWTVDDPALARRAIELGARSITTNRPGWLREQLK